MSLQIWNIATPEGDEWQYANDPEQIVFAHVRGLDAMPEFTAEDGQVTTYAVGAISIKDGGSKGGFVDLVTVPKGDTTLYVTDRRAIAVKRGVDLGASVAVRALDYVLPGSVLVRDLIHDATRKVGARPKYHFVAQIEYQSTTLVRYVLGRRFLENPGVQLVAYLGEPQPNAIMQCWVELDKTISPEALARDIARRVQRAQLSRTILPLVAARHERTSSTAVFERSGNGFISNSFDSVALNAYAEARRAARG